MLGTLILQTLTFLLLKKNELISNENVSQPGNLHEHFKVDIILKQDKHCSCISKLRPNLLIKGSTCHHCSDVVISKTFFIICYETLVVNAKYSCLVNQYTKKCLLHLKRNTCHICP